MSQFPPQAYTRDMLSTAYEWLRSQPSQVRELAKDSDSLVALYLQSRRRSENAITQPVPSAEEFKQDLKNLAEGMRQFEETRPMSPNAPRANRASTAPHHVATMYHAPTQHNISINPSVNITPQVHHTTAPMPSVNSTAHMPQPQTPQMPAQQVASVVHTTPDTSSALTIDFQTREKLRHVQFRLNLSSESEALRLLVAVGFDNIHSILPK